MITKIGILGAGQMGNGIAHVFAQYGYRVVLFDIAALQLEKALKTIGQNLAGESQDALFDSAADEVPPVLGPTKLVQPGRARKAR